MGGSALSGIGGYLKNNAPMIGSAASGILGVRQDEAGNKIKSDQLAFEQQQYQQQYADEQARKKRMAELLGPLFASLSSNFLNHNQQQQPTQMQPPTTFRT